MRNRKGSLRAGFTLVEVMIAVGVIAISLTALIGLLGAVTQKLSQVRSQSKAIMLLADVDVILKNTPFNVVYDWVKTPGNSYAIYFWDERQNTEDLDSISLVTVSSEDPGRAKNTMPRPVDLSNAQGDIYRVLLSLNESGLKNANVDIKSPDVVYGGGSLPGSSDQYGEAFLPITMDIHIEPRDDIIDGRGTDDKNNQRRVHRDWTVKMR